MTKKGFFREIEDKTSISQMLAYFVFIIGTTLLWVYVAVPAQEKNAMIYVVMIIAFGVVIGFDVTGTFLSKKKGEALVRINGLGKTRKAITRAFLYGAAAALALGFFVPQFLIQPLSIVSEPLLSFLFIVIAAPFVEAVFFRGAVQPILVEVIERNVVKENFVAGGIATVVQSLGFAWFHINIFGATGDFMPYFVFGVIATIGVYAFRSISFEFGLHGINNYLAWIVMPK